jgi:hypothetical protein
MHTPEGIIGNIGNERSLCPRTPKDLGVGQSMKKGRLKMEMEEDDGPSLGLH